MSEPKEVDNAFIPTIQELIASFSTGLVLLAILNTTKIVDYYRNIDKIFGEDTLPFRIALLDKINPRLIITAETFAVWAIVGLLVYLGLWFVISIFGEAGQGANVVHGFVFPKKADRQRFSIDLARRFGIRMLALATGFMWLVLLLTYVVPSCSVYFYLIFTSEQSPEIAWKALVSIISMGLYLFLLAPISRMLVLKPRVFSDW